MTVLTKPNIIKKPDITKYPLVADNNYVCDERVDIEMMTKPPGALKRSTAALLCMSIVAVLVAITGVSCGLVLYRQYLRSTTLRRYQGFCSIPIDTAQLQAAAQDQLIEENYQERRVMPLPWTSAEVQVFSTADEGPSDDFANLLREEFDIGDRVEKIKVFDNGRTIRFIHDFDDNVTGIVDTDRCFVMDLDPTLVLEPEVLMFGIAKGDDFDVTRVRSTLRALLPALRSLARHALLAAHCAARPAYRLAPAPAAARAPLIRKRAVDAPPHDYIQFAGKQVQEIEIANLAELLAAEQSHA